MSHPNLNLSQARIMAVLNVTPDSFYDGGQCYSSSGLELDRVLRKVEQQISEGADIIDVGGESTRPGAEAVSVDEELLRVAPVVEAVSQRFDVAISVDTSKPEVMLAAAQAGAHLINDVRGLQLDGALEAAAKSSLHVCLMHMQGQPDTMQHQPNYDDAVLEVYNFLAERKRQAQNAGIAESKIWLDPGIGFGKSDEHNLALIRELQRFSDLGPVLLGVSRKSMFGRLLGRDLNERLAGSLAVAVIALQNGAKILRVHDIAATRDAVIMYDLTHK